MTTTTAPSPVIVSATATESDLSHTVCECDENAALCGLDVTEFPWDDDEDSPECVVCEDLDDQPCERCGA